MKNILSIIGVVLLLAILAGLPFVIKNVSTINLIIQIFMYVILASAWNILGGYAGQISLGHAAYFGLGALLARLLWINAGVHILPSILAGGLLAVVFALIIGLPAFRLKGVYFTIGTLALAQILFVTVGNIWPYNSSFTPAEMRDFNELNKNIYRYYLFLVLVVSTVGTVFFLARSKLGLGMMAVKEEEDAAESLGVSALKHKIAALVLSAFFTGLAGGGFAYYFTSFYLNYTFSPIWSLDVLTMVFIGGQGTILGPIIGAIFFVVLKEFLVLNLGEYHLLVFGVLFILVVLFLPGGIISAWKITQRAVTRRIKSGNSRTSLKKGS